MRTKWYPSFGTRASQTRTQHFPPASRGDSELQCNALQDAGVEFTNDGEKGVKLKAAKAQKAT